MSGVIPIRWLLASSAAVTAAVPAESIASDLPLDVPLPAIEVTQISDIGHRTIASGAGTRRARIQVTVHARSRPEQKTIQKLARAALPRMRGAVNGVFVESLVDDVIGPDLRNDDIGSKIGSQDFIVTYVE